MTVDIKTTLVNIPNQDLQIAGYLAQPVAVGHYPVVIVIQEIFGVNSHIRDVTERIAKEGCVAIAPAIYQRQAPGFETGYTPESIEAGKKLKDQTDSAEILSDLEATIAYGLSLPNVKPGGVGLIGFCFGGWITYLGASLPTVKATASFYGAGIPHWAPGSAQPPIAYTDKIEGTLYAFFGLEDASIPMADTEQIEQALSKYQVNHKIFRYPGADHGFFCDQRASYNAEAAADAWQKVKQLFQTELQ
ncbi:dienelactone hydrolase family protein [Synechocystis sp. PCC 7339]|uniref:dienelactone hydrolase family protein n=1 Tax=unclassified Synechocystis TaxID=2640012 RepID=UPI001BAE697A|nr:MULTISPECIES: dienelactone hydrolase family protein [unclassified Synechocystis]QUS59395.1 dienelactone hydrolase family protein [Synechocystis sp. PCC 7338]UAJ71578.1 dienelactone hydrolase family protein [Synechocystis sp. PCC 7339]